MGLGDALRRAGRNCGGGGEEAEMSARLEMLGAADSDGMGWTIFRRFCWGIIPGGCEGRAFGGGVEGAGGAAGGVCVFS